MAFILCHRTALKRIVAHLESVAGPDDAPDHGVADITVSGLGVVVLLKPLRVSVGGGVVPRPRPLPRPHRSLTRLPPK